MVCYHQNLIRRTLGLTICNWKMIDNAKEVDGLFIFDEKPKEREMSS